MDPDIRRPFGEEQNLDLVVPRLSYRAPFVQLACAACSAAILWPRQCPLTVPRAVTVGVGFPQRVCCET